MYIFSQYKKIVSNYNKFRNQNIFVKNPLVEDNLVKKEAERYEKARIEKKLKNLILHKGVNSLNKINNIDDLLRECKHDEDLNQFKFENEIRRNKESFGKFSKYDIVSKRLRNKNNKSSNLRDLANKSSQQSLQSSKNKIKANNNINNMLFSLNIQVNDKLEVLTFYSNDNPILVCENFCLKNGIKGNDKDKIKAMIDQRLLSI